MTALDDDTLAQLRGLTGAGRHREAIALCEKLLADGSDSAVVWNCLGISHRALGMRAEAVRYYWKALELAPRSSVIWSNAGNVLTDLHQTATALAAHRRAVRLAPGDAGAHLNHGIALGRAGAHAAAVEAFNRADALRPDDPQILWERARAHLYVEDYGRGWEDYERRFDTGQLPRRNPPAALWDGRLYVGRRLLILTEQGFGDALWAARWFKRVKQLGGTLIIEARRELVDFFARQGFADQVIAEGDELPVTDYYINQCSLARLYARNREEITGDPYLRADEPRIAALAPLFADAGAALRVGIVWSGSVTFKGNSDRAQRLTRFLAALRLPGVKLYSLQKGPPEKELREAEPGAIVDLSPRLNNFADTAAALHHLHLVIMTDSAVAHLAGALGRPVWVLLNRVPHWLWLSERADSPWYGSMRLFRAPSWDDWSSVFDGVAASLLDLAERAKTDVS